MKKRILFILSIIVSSYSLQAQFNTCNEAFNNILCYDIDGFMSTLPASNSAGQPPAGGCGITPHNVTWFAFVAGTASIQLDLLVGTCGPTLPGCTAPAGLQAAVYSACGTPWPTVACIGNGIPPGTTQPLFLNNLTVGGVYFFMLDGNCGSVCDYTINVASGSTLPPTPVPPATINGVTQGCPGGTITYSVNPVFGADHYNWTLPDGTTLDMVGETVSYTFGVGGNICVEASNGCETTAPVCIPVTLGPAPTAPDVDIVRCPGDPVATYGTSIYPTSGTFLNTDFSDPLTGCDIETMVNVEYVPVLTTPLSETICAGETSQMVGGQVFTTTGLHPVTIPNYQGCDSTITLDLTVLDPIAAIIPITDPTFNTINCLTQNTGVFLNAIPYAGQGIVSYSWSGPNGAPFSGPGQGTPSITVVDAGIYSLVVTQLVNGVLCTNTIPASWEVFEDLATPTATTTATAAIDCNSGTGMIDGSGLSTGPCFVYAWIGPNGFMSTDQNPVVTEPGNYTPTVTNICNFCSTSGPAVNVTGSTASVAVASAVNTVISCTNGTATLDATGSSPGAIYTWSNSGGTIGTGLTINVMAAGTYTLTVDNGSGCNGSTTIDITADTGIPNADISISNTLDCITSSATLDASGSTGTGLTYSWQSPPGNEVGTGTTYLATNPGPVTLVVTGSNGCTHTTTENVIDNSSIISATITVSGTISCTSGTVTLEAINVMGTSSPSYSWTDVATGTVLGTGPSIQVTSTGMIDVEIFDANTGCTISYTENVTGDSSLPTSLASSSNDLDCNNTSSTLSSSGSTTGPNITYSWQSPLGNEVGTGATYNAITAGTYFLVVTNGGNGCTAESAPLVVAQDAATPTASVATPGAIDCNNLTVTLDGSGSVSSNGGAVTYAWTDPITGTVLGTGATLPVTGATDVILTVTQSNGCTDATQIISVVDNTTTVSVQATASGMITCTSGPVTLNAVSPMGSPNPTYTWTDPSGAAGGTGVSVPASTPGTWTVEISDPTSGCTSTATVVVGSNTTPPDAMAMTANNLTCTVVDATLDGSASTSGTGITYTWTDQTGATVGTGSIITVNLPGTYTLTVLDPSTGCDATTTTSVTLDDTPPVAVAGANATLLCGQASATLDGSGSSTGPNFSYEWKNASGATVGTGITFAATAAGDYTLCVTNATNGCTETDVATVSTDANVPNVSATATNNNTLDCNFSSITLTGNTTTTAPITGEWQDAAGMVLSTMSDLVVNTPGTYFYVVTNTNNNCDATAQIIVSDDMQAPMADAGIDQTLTCSASMVPLNGSGSTAGSNITYEWFLNNVSQATTSNFDATTAGIYTLVVTNIDNGCTDTDDVEVLLDSNLPTAITTNTDIDCNGDAILDGTGSTTGAGIEYAWINSAGATISTDLITTISTPDPMIILVTTNTNNGCTTTSPAFEVFDNTTPPVLAAVNTTGQLTCLTTDALLDGTGSEAGPNITYEWTGPTGSTPGADITYTATIAGNYTFLITNTLTGCTSSTNIAVTEDVTLPTAVVASSTTPTLTCTSPTASLDGTGSSTGGFSYLWTEVGGTFTSTDLITSVGTAGTYELVVTNDVTGCSETSVQVVVTQDSNVPMADIAVDGDLTCTNLDVVLDGTGSTASGTISYEWTNVTTGMPAGTTPTITATSNDEFSLVITDASNGCTSSTALTVVSDTEDPEALIATTTNLDCNNMMTTIDGSASSTGPNFTYEWTSLLSGTVGANATLDVTVADTYTLLVTNTINGCTSTETVIITEDFNQPAIDAGLGSTITCLDPTATLNGSGSASGANITYEWSVGGTVISTDPTNPNFDVILPGNYILTVYDSNNGCSSVSTAIIVDEDVTLPQANAGMPQTLTCANLQEVTLSGSGSDTGPGFTLEWFNSAMVSQGAGVTLTVTTPDTYTLLVTNTTTGCSETSTVLVDENIAAPTADAGTGGTLTCGTASFQLVGSTTSTSMVSYAWKDANGNVVSTTPIFDAGAAGVYTFCVTDMINGCTNENTAEVLSDTNSPAALVAPVATLTCATGMATIDASASTVAVGSPGTLVFDWTSPAGTNLGSTSTIDVTTPGEYILLITDSANGCSATLPVNVNQDIMPPVAEAGQGGTLVCGQLDQLLDASASSTGAPGAFTYTWFDANMMQVGTGLTYPATTAQIYTLEVLNVVNGCTSTDIVEVLQDNNVPTINASVLNELTCAVTSATIDGSASSGIGTLSYSWTDATSTEIGTAATLNVSSPGTYTLTIIDASNMCSTSEAFVVTENTDPPTALIGDINGLTLSCGTSSLVFDGTGSSVATTSGGTLSYGWALNGNPIGIMSDIVISEAGTLVLAVLDSETGCTSTASVTIITDASVPSVNIAQPNPLTCIVTETMIDATASSAGLEYLWTGPGNITNETTLTPTVDATGTYTLTITNPNNGCTSTGTVSLTADTDLPTVVASAMDQFDCVTTEISLMGTGTSTGNFTYEWTTANGVIVSGANSLSPTISAPGNYTLTAINNATGCINSADVSVSANVDVPDITDFTVNMPNCFGESNGSIILDNVTGGQAPYLYSIDDGAFAPVDQFSFLTAGNYTIVVQDANGCESTEVITVNEPAELLVELGDDVFIQLGEDHTINPQIVGGFDTIFWTNCDAFSCDTITPYIQPYNTNMYSVTVIDGNGCISTDQVTVFVEKKREVYMPNVFTPNGDGENDYFLPFAGPEVRRITEFRVFSRWGEQVFEKLNYKPEDAMLDDGWDGRFVNQPMNPQVFVYYVEVEFLDGRREIIRGDVALRR